MFSLKLLISAITFSLLFTWINGSTKVDRKPYIVYMGDITPEMASSVIHHHHTLLSTAIGDEKIAKESKIHSYGKSFNAFAAKLLPDEANRLRDMDDVVSVFPNTIMKLHTTRSWDFLGMAKTVKRNPKIESNIIVGLLDSGIYIESPSFNDKGYGPPPAKWKGKCEKGANFTGCNNKVVGARFYRMDDPSSRDSPTPADNLGHGTHTASTVAGTAINGANLYGLARGTARGGVASARIAMYKVCWGNGCNAMDMLAAFDDAIADGVDLISVSIGGTANSYFNDPISIGAFHSSKKGILTTCSGGNDGPIPYTVTNLAPWILTVAASAIDRKFRTEVRLGNGKKIPGWSVNTFSPRKKSYPLISGEQASNSTDGSYEPPSSCELGTLDRKKVNGRIVYCPTEGAQETGKDYAVKTAGGVGVIVQSIEKLDTAFAFVLPGSSVRFQEGNMINDYINTTKKPTAVIEKSSTSKIIAPFVASFSSRGPNTISNNILKPDITAPGVDILAGWSRLVAITEYDDDKRRVNFNIISGTSMACPHVAAAAAYVKSFHPDWSPAAIRSALMTTATEMKIHKNDTEFGYGSGQMDPTRALHPGLIYDLTTASYISFLCKEGFNGSSIGLLLGSKNVDCSQYQRAEGVDGLNYPSMQLQVNRTQQISGIFYRMVTNVEKSKSVYKATVRSPKGLSISVVPKTLEFNRVHESKSFKVVVKGNALGRDSLLSGSIVWSDSKHRVRSPIVVFHATPPDQVIS